jgi:hypothetical protein
VTGNPVSAEVLAAAADRDVAAARATLGVPSDRTMVTVFAGSLGARSINRATWSAAERWSDRSDLAVYHVIGARDWDDRPDVARRDGDVDDASGNGLWYRPVRYEDRMETVLAASDLAVCRAGGTSVAELAVIGVPAVLVPLPIATRDHQRANAAPLVAAGAAVLIDDDRFDVDTMVATVDPLVADGELARMAEAEREFLIRSGRALEPTPRAEALMAELGPALLTIAGTLNGATPFDPAVDARTFRVGWSDDVAIAVMPLLARLRDTAPQCRLVIRSANDVAATAPAVPAGANAAPA